MDTSYCKKVIFMEDYYVDNSEIVSLIDEWRNSEEKQSLEKKILDKIANMQIKVEDLKDKREKLSTII